MTRRDAHLVVGWLGFATFVGTGVWMMLVFDHDGLDPVRVLFRANHVYILFASLINLAAAQSISRGAKDAGSTRAMVRAACLISSVAILIAAFFVEPPRETLIRPLTAVGTLAVFAGIVIGPWRAP